MVRDLVERNDEETGLNGKAIREYLSRYDDRVLQHEFTKYKEDELKDYPQVKDILKPRLQFNGRQKEIYYHLVGEYAKEH